MKEVDNQIKLSKKELNKLLLNLKNIKEFKFMQDINNLEEFLKRLKSRRLGR